MSAQTAFADELAVIYSARKNGRLFLYCRANEFGVRGRPAEADFISGELVGFRFGGHSGVTALAELNEHHRIDRAMFVAAAVDGQPADDSLPATDKLLALLIAAGQKPRSDRSRSGCTARR